MRCSNKFLSGHRRIPLQSERFDPGAEGIRIFPYLAVQRCIHRVSQQLLFHNQYSMSIENWNDGEESYHEPNHQHHRQQRLII